MDEQRIDRLARLLATGVGRRRIATGLAGVLLGGLMLPRPALAGCKKAGKRCDKNNDCCDHATCKGDTCQCKNRFKACDGTCVDLDKDKTYCGRCDKTCGAAETCVAGACTTAEGCPVGADFCSGNGSINCSETDPSCQCAVSTEGETLCGTSFTQGATCGQCETSADCVFFGQGAFCVEAGSTSTGCCAPGAQTVCRRRCPG